MNPSVTETGRQLLLFPQPGDGPSFASFRTDGPPPLAVETCRALALGTRAGYGVLYGPPGCGKSHLLRAACETWTERGGQAALWIPDPRSAPPAPGGQLPFGFLGIESLDELAGHAELERSCFAFVLAAQQGRLRLLLAGRSPPVALAWKFPDLASRLIAMTLPALLPIAEILWPEILKSRCEERGMKLDTAAARWLLRHGPRRLGALLALVDELADRGGAVGRKITIPWIRQRVLQGSLNHPASPGSE